MAVLHTVAVKATNLGGRLFDGISENEIRVNGEFGFLGAYADNTHGVKDGQTQIKVFEVPTNTAHGQANFGRMPVVIMQPEMMYDNSRKSLLKLELMDIEPKTPFACVPLQEGDKIQASVEVFHADSQGNPLHLVVGQQYVLTDDETVLTNSQNQPINQDGTVYFEIVKVKPAHARSARIGGKFAEDNYDLYTLEVKVYRA